MPTRRSPSTQPAWPRTLRGRLFALVACTVVGRVPDVDGVREVPPEDLTDNPPDDDRLILDVRTSWEYARGHVSGAMNVPYTRIKKHIGALASYRDREIILYCERGYRALVAADSLGEAGFQRLGHLVGDMRNWRASGLPLVRKSSKA